MQLSHQLSMKRLAFTDRPPSEKSDVTDDAFLSSLMKCKHSRYVGLSHCYQLTSDVITDALSLCVGIQYLDLSYVQIERLDTLHLCSLLTSLSLAGNTVLQGVSWQPLSHIHSLQLISLRNSSFSDCDLLSGLCKLRSLDLGGCIKVSCIGPLADCTRLEELVLDESGVEADGASLDCLATLPLLSILNLYGTPLSADTDVYERLEGAYSAQAAMENAPRDLAFLRAIVENNLISARQHIDAGIDLNRRIGPWAHDLFKDLFRDKCEGAGPFFDCLQPLQEYRPLPVHLAIFFNAQEVLAAIVFAGCDREATAWFGDMRVGMKDGQERLIVDEAKTKEYAIVRAMKMGGSPDDVLVDDEGLLHSPLEVMDHIFERNFHRITCGLRRRKVYNWKEICSYSKSRIEGVLERNIDRILKRLGTMPAEAMSAAERERNNAETALARAQDKTQAMQAGHAIPEKQTDDAVESTDAGAGSVSMQGADPKSSGSTHDTGEEGGAEKLEGLEADAKESVIQEEEKEKEGEKEEDKDEEEEEENPLIRRGGFCREDIPYDGSCNPWHTCGLVSKVEGTPLTIVTVGGAEKTALGKRDFWLESIAQNLDTRHAEEDAIRRRAKFPARAYRATSLPADKFTDINPRMEVIHKLAAKEYARRSILRDDITEDD